MEILQEIGSYAGIAAILGLAVLSALYFSQARDVKRLREWAGRAPERGPTPAVPEPRGVVAQPIARPAGKPVPGGTPPPVPRPPGAQPATPAAASAAGAAPAVASGPQVADEDDELDVTALDTVVHPPPTPLEQDGDEEESEDRSDEDAEAPAAAGDGDVAVDGHVEDESDDQGDDDSDDVPADDEDEDVETGEWQPEDEHSGVGFTDEHDAVGPATAAATAPRPPTPPRPYQRRGGPAPAAGSGRDRAPILPPYAEARPQSDDARPRSPRGRPVLLVIAAMVAIAVVAFGALQLTGGDEPGSGDGAGLSAGGDSDGDGGSGGGGDDAQPVVPAEVTVSVLNGTTVPGLAATIGDQIQGEGFQLGTVTNNFDQQRAESVVLYAPSAEREAANVGRRLDISQREAIDAESQALAGDATVVVVAGADQNQ